MCRFFDFSDFAQKDGKKYDSSLKNGKNVTKDFLEKKKSMKTLYKMNPDKI